MLQGKRILLVIAGGIAAYRSLELIRALREQRAAVRCVMTHGAQQFVTPMAAAALSGDRVFTELFSLTDEAEMGHIRLSREADLVVVAPATADLMAKMAAGLADDLASTVLLATDKPVMACPAMNTMMWNHPATQRNVARLKADGVAMLGPDAGDLACGEVGRGRMSQPAAIVAAIAAFLDASTDKPLAGRHALVTSGPTHEPIDPVRFIANRSSGKQGHAIAAACARLGARVTLVSGPVNLPDPAGVEIVKVETAREMLAACEAALPADVAICAAAVADWRVASEAATKLKKDGGALPTLSFAENPDILATLAARNDRRPRLVIGFAAETGDVVTYARAKLARKGCDWIVANDVSTGTGTFGGDDNTVFLVGPEGVEDWPRMSKQEVADTLARRIAGHLAA
ncbi:MAG: bifunctional phosphopantothenoylcysteine decarboxylase/phosphopantothenate--cysteine ligase CoaBC [Proteobacteria bacterium]|nr:bifunctional phosphopantothenoylcysteine decarboxylase/phosphopantothenate--cysteine ligase CoaBC [Pseudomonadota bacterium]MDA0952171.1 bifunctional phosphopantothenoylcysteine decarboxylase/phosphopantothenate--cysteine ligase CoaBC [Pseudomonadota bacterium]MDA1072280.1 bifunctional phosphopantothenoylcysteine decarboxylase/phosphopantothenate--cysteine ligase CoaBC [Pseudomonadota bacterium]